MKGFGVVWGVVACLLSAALARGQLAAGSNSGDRPGLEHAWVVVPSSPDGPMTLWHLPPRGGPGPAEDGAARPIAAVERMPTAMAAAGGRVWLVVPGAGERPGYGLLAASVQRGAIEGTWFTGAGGRLGPVPFLSTSGRLVALGAGGRGPVGLVEGADGALSLAWLDMGRWRWATTPMGARPTALGVGAGGELVLAAVEGGALHTWRASLPEPTTGEGEHYELIDPEAIIELAKPRARDDRVIVLQWVHRVLDLPDGLGVGAIVAGPVEIGPRVVLGLSDGVGLWVVEASESGSRVLHEGTPGAVALLTATRRGIVARAGEPAAGAPGRAATKLDLVEFSLDTGLVLHTGPAVFDGPVSPSDLRILALLVVLVSASLLLFVVRTTGETAPYSPPGGSVLAPPVTRLLAAMADGLLALFLGGELARLLPDGWLAIRLGADVLDFGPLATALVVGYLAGSGLEAALGRTPGKFLFGLFISRSGLEGGTAWPLRRPGLGASLARNAVKWLLPFVALAGAMGPTRRHRGDAMARLGVVVSEPARANQDPRPDDR